MSRTSNQVNQRSGISKKAISQKQDHISNRVDGNRELSGCYGFRLPKRLEVSPPNILKRLGSNLAKALCSWRRSSPRVSSSGRPRASVASTDAHKSEAIEDCIEFINSSSFPRSNPS